MSFRKSLLQATYRSRTGSHEDTGEERLMLELTDRSLENIRRLITRDRLSPSDLSRRLEWTPPQGRDRRLHGSPSPPQQ